MTPSRHVSLLCTQNYKHTYIMREYITTTNVGTYTTRRKYGYPRKIARWQSDDLPT